jgi:hypothetical protein
VTVAKKNKELIAFEGDFDAAVAGLRLFSFPLRTALTGFWGVTDGLLHARNFSSRPAAARPHAGAALASRLSYLTPHLLRCPLEPLGADALDAQSPLQDDPSLLAELMLLVQYGHFCELMPEFHRGYYVATGDRSTGFVLQHPDTDVAKYECKDIVLSELALPFGIRTQPIPHHIVARIADGRDMQLFAIVAKARYVEVSPLVVEAPVLTDAGCLAAVGVTAQEFGAYRAACFAIADCCLALVDEYAHRLETDNADQGAWREFLEWRNVCLKGNFVLALIEVLSGLSQEQINQVTGLFAVGCSGGRPNAAADGFFPPFWWLSDDVVMFNPDVLMLMLSSRNIPFALNRLDQGTFDDRVSTHLEPALVTEALGELAGLNVQAVEGANWDQGEFDVLLFEEQTNTAVHLQAKAAIPAQGARMVRAVETRSREGLEQLRVFRELPQGEKDRVLAKALGREVKDVAVVDVLLTRSGIGSWKVWKELAGAIPANPALIRAARRRAPPTLRDLVLSLPDVLDEITSAASDGWVQTPTTLWDVPFEIPLLDLKNKYLEQLRLTLAGVDTRSAAIDAANMWVEIEGRLGIKSTPPAPTKPGSRSTPKRKRGKKRKRSRKGKRNK